MGRNISVDHAAGPDEGILADRYAADDGTVSAERRAALHQRRTVFVLAGDSRARIVDVGKHHAGTAKHIVLKADGVVYRDVVLDFHIVANDDIVGDEDVLPKRAARTDSGPRTDMRSEAHTSEHHSLMRFSSA